MNVLESEPVKKQKLDIDEHPELVVALHAVIFTMIRRMPEFGPVTTGKKAYTDALIEKKNVFPILQQVTHSDVVAWRAKMQRDGFLCKWNTGEEDPEAKRKKEEAIKKAQATKEKKKKQQ